MRSWRRQLRSYAAMGAVTDTALQAIDFENILKLSSDTPPQVDELAKQANTTEAKALFMAYNACREATEAYGKVCAMSYQASDAMKVTSSSPIGKGRTVVSTFSLVQALQRRLKGEEVRADIVKSALAVLDANVPLPLVRVAEAVAQAKEAAWSEAGGESRGE